MKKEKPEATIKGLQRRIAEQDEEIGHLREVRESLTSECDSAERRAAANMVLLEQLQGDYNIYRRVESQLRVTETRVIKAIAEDRKYREGAKESAKYEWALAK